MNTCLALFARNRYPDYPLGGCLNDARLFARTLVQCAVWSGYSADLIDPQFDEHVRTGTLTTALAATRHAPTILYYSGHGTRVPNLAEPDGYCEGLFLGPGDVLRDADLLARLADRDAPIEIVLDSCFSGGMARAPDGGVRSVPCPSPRHDILLAANGGRNSGVRIVPLTAALTALPHVHLWMASKEGQAAMETVIGGQTHGVFTYSLCSRLRAHPELSRAELLADINLAMARQGYAQRADLRSMNPDMPFGWLGTTNEA